MQGVCKLCLETKDLQDSHFFPKAAYAITKKRGGGESPILVVNNDHQRFSMQTDRQYRAYALCSSCEQLFSRNGENEVMRRIARPNGFALLEELKSLSADARGHHYPP